MTKKEREKLTVLLSLVNDLKELCKKHLEERKVKKDPYSRGYISGELNTLEIMKQSIEKAWKR